MQNYFNYFTEIEEHFQRRRGTTLLLSTLDWALIETWKESGIPLDAVLRGIDAAFEHFERRPSKTRKVNSLAFCSQEVLAAAEEMKEAAIGTKREEPKQQSGFSPEEVAGYLKRNAKRLRECQVGEPARRVAGEIGESLERLAEQISENDSGYLRLEETEALLTVWEEKLQAVLLTATPDDELVKVKAEADRQIAPYRGKMNAAQLQQLQRQYLQQRLLQRYGLPRLSLFYM